MVDLQGVHKQTSEFVAFSAESFNKQKEERDEDTASVTTNGY
jgi:hypothetical protein